ncbi:hypothetical protein MMC17_004317 [Xylographa soralifera]|nr:hypothetical protein [Xylographa soralifera]
MRSFEGYSSEKLAHRDGYERRDIEDRLPFLDSKSEADGTSVEAKFATCPAVLKPDVNMEEATSRVKKAFPLSRTVERGETKKVLFMHAPANDSPKDIQKGVDIVTALLKTVLRQVHDKELEREKQV